MRSRHVGVVLLLVVVALAGGGCGGSGAAPDGGNPGTGGAGGASAVGGGGGSSGGDAVSTNGGAGTLGLGAGGDGRGGAIGVGGQAGSGMGASGIAGGPGTGGTTGVGGQTGGSTGTSGTGGRPGIGGTTGAGGEAGSASGAGGTSAGGAAGAGGVGGTVGAGGGSGGAAGSAGAGGTGGSSGTTAYDGDWSGSTGQGKTILFRIMNGQVTYVRFGYSGSSAGCSVDGTTSTNATTTIVGGSFTQMDTTSTFDYTLSGTFSSVDTASGTLSFVSSSAPGTPACTVNDSTTWTASQSPPGPSYDGSWSGQTSVGKPISFVVSNNAIASISFGYAISGGTGCAIDSMFSGTLSSAPIVASQADIVGGIRPVNYSGSLTFGSATEASGTLRVSYFDTSVSPPCAGSTNPTFTVTKQ